MKWVGRIFPIIVVFLLICAILNILFKDSIIAFLKIHIPFLEGFFSGPWWQSAPAWLLSTAASITLFIAINQFHQSRKSTNAQIAIGLLHEFRKSEAVEILRKIYERGEIDPSNLTKLSGSDERNIEYILDRFEALGILVEKGIIDEELAADAYAGASSLRCWDCLSSYIKQRSADRGPYSVHYEAYARRCLDYFIKRKFPVKLEIKNQNPINILYILKGTELEPRTLKEIKREADNNWDSSTYDIKKES